MKTSRRELMLAAAAAPALSSAELEDAALANSARSVELYLRNQNNDPASRWYGGWPDAFGLHHGGAPMAIFDTFSAALVHPKSKYRNSPEVFASLQRAATFLDRHTSPAGNIHNLITNFNSPPDTAFGARGMAMGARLAQLHNARELLALTLPHLEKAGRAMAQGGLHTPNHRWIMCSSLAQINEVAPDPAYTKRIEAWLREGIDIDADGQYSERSTGTYNMVVNSSLVLLADKLKRWNLLEPVRRNLDATLHLMEFNGELLTDISTRQDQYTRATIASYWFVLHYLALRDRNPVFAGLALPHVKTHMPLSYAMTWPEFLKTDLPTAAPPSNYVRHFPVMGVTRIRRGALSGTIQSQRDSRLFQVRNGEAVVNAVRFASGFFGKGQFRAAKFQAVDNAYVLTQELRAPYYQPIDKSVGMDFEAVRKERAQTEICTLTQSARIVEKPDGFDVVIEAKGTDEVPVVIEINLREGGTVEGVEKAAEAPDSSYLKAGHAVYRQGADALRIGPGRHEHRWIVVRGGEKKLPGPSLYLTGFTPFTHTLSFRKA